MLLLLDSPNNAQSSSFLLQNVSNSHSCVEKNYTLKTRIQTKVGTPSVALISSCVRADAGELSSRPHGAFLLPAPRAELRADVSVLTQLPTPRGKQWECCALRDGCSPYVLLRAVILTHPTEKISQILPSTNTAVYIEEHQISNAKKLK